MRLDVTWDRQRTPFFQTTHQLCLEVRTKLNSRGEGLWHVDIVWYSLAWLFDDLTWSLCSIQGFASGSSDLFCWDARVAKIRCQRWIGNPTSDPSGPSGRHCSLSDVGTISNAKYIKIHQNTSKYINIYTYTLYQIHRYTSKYNTIQSKWQCLRSVLPKAVAVWESCGTGAALQTMQTTRRSTPFWSGR